MWSFTTILSTKFRSLRQTVQNALSRLYRRASHLIHLLLRVAAAHKPEIILTLIVLSYLVDLGFTLLEFDAEVEKKYHPFYDGITFQDGRHWNGWVTKANFVYGLLAMVSRALLFSAVILTVLFRIRIVMTFVVCLILECLDMVDYWLFRNGPWFVMYKVLIFDNWEFEFNYIKIGLVISFSYIEWERLKYTGSLE